MMMEGFGGLVVEEITHLLEGLRDCVRLDPDCADVCAATGAIGARAADGSSMLRACAEACRACKEARNSAGSASR